ncbi:TEA domain-containing protein [Mycena sanguinolenta]|uniref:TEA domain-containing protein n=1 Tax=Mycena sanguinolenta TaxID=230812 RepID=A0A8H6ZDJ5_9AGAR|nr:TEA domain-containing protein [Mycena sanguinolenta]
MDWRQGDNSPSTSGFSNYSPSAPSPNVPGSSLNKNLWLGPTIPNQTTKEVLEAVLAARKSWKISRGGETVWPLDLEAALLEGHYFNFISEQAKTMSIQFIGLERYQPEDCRETRMLGRHPRRNCFISDYIFDKTGKFRSPKQVGSRLQQLRESCGGTPLKKLLCPTRTTAAHSSTSDSTDGRPSSPIFAFTAASSHHIVIYVDILPEESSHRMHRGNNSSSWPEDGGVLHISEHPRDLRFINPTISFSAASPIVANSRFTVYSGDLILHAETLPLQLVTGGPHHRSVFLYSVQLVPKYWKVILDSRGTYDVA